MARLVVVAALAVLALAAALPAYAIELDAVTGRRSADPDVAPVFPPVASPCSRRCADEANQCAEECVFGSAGEEEEFACREVCVRETTRCVKSCGKKDAAARVSPMEREAAKAQPPRPPSQNQGYGPETVVNFAGYVNVSGTTPQVHRYLWYWFFESRSDPLNDPLIIWMTGGPGCSSQVALFAENGPYKINPDLSLSLNPYSWNNNASVIWIDQPVNTGFSYADSGDLGVSTEKEVAQNMYEFIQGFLQQYPKYASLPLIITGESYAGHYVPATANRILQGNAEGGFKLNLQAIGIGNGLVDPQIQYTQYLPFATANQILSNFSLGVMSAGLPLCEGAIGACMNGTGPLASEACLLAAELCNLSQLEPYQLSGRNVYNFAQKCQDPPLCYNFTDVASFLALPQVQEALGVVGRQWQDCNRLVDMEFVFSGDWMQDLAVVVPNILASGVRVVVYSGDLDFICNFYGGQAWTSALVWPGQDAFNAAPNVTWSPPSMGGQAAGSSRTAEGLTFVRVFQAGHMVPMDQPVAALDLVRRIISGQPFDNSEPYFAAEPAIEPILMIDPVPTPAIDPIMPEPATVVAEPRVALE